MEYSKKNNLEQTLKNCIVTGLNNNIFSGASVAVSQLGINGFERVTVNAGKTDFEKGSQDIENNVFYDLASLTKPLVTVLSLFQLVREKKLTLTDTLKDIFPEKQFVYHHDVTIGQLLSHCSGMSAHKEFYNRKNLLNQKDKKKAVIEAVFNQQPEYDAGSNHIYSDLGFLVLGAIIEKIVAGNLDEYWYKEICQPLGLEKYFLFPPVENRQNVYAVTGICPWTKRKLVGQVHDDNCRFMGGVAGHAGLFGTIDGVRALCEVILESVLGKGKNLHLFSGLDNWVKRLGQSNWSYGFDMVAKIGSSSGKYFSSTSIGHLGFTGVSFWIDIKQRIIIVFLTNRVLNPSDNSAIKKFRPLIHDKIMEVFLSQTKRVD